MSSALWPEMSERAGLDDRDAPAVDFAVLGWAVDAGDMAGGYAIEWRGSDVAESCDEVRANQCVIVMVRGLHEQQPAMPRHEQFIMFIRPSAHSLSLHPKSLSLPRLAPSPARHLGSPLPTSNTHSVCIPHRKSAAQTDTSHNSRSRH